jgi:hypothetical protein
MKLATSITLAGATVLALANVAAAENNLAGTKDPVLLTDAQMDNVTAGDAGANVFLNTFSPFGSASISGNVFLFVDAAPPFQQASAVITSVTDLFEGAVSISQGAGAFTNQF